MCGVHLQEVQNSAPNSIGIEHIKYATRSKFQLFGQVKRKNQDGKVEEVKYRGRGRKTWNECVKDMVEFGLYREWVLIVSGIGLNDRNRLTSASMDNGRN